MKEQYSKLKDAYTSTNERFFVKYALNGSIVVPEKGLRAGMPVDHPISGPVSEPSPLNNRWWYDKRDISITGIL